MKQIATWTFVVIWFFHLVVGAGSGFAALRIWRERHNEFARFTMIHLHAAIADALGAIVAVFLAKGVRFTWTFAIVLFSAMLVRDLVRLPLIVFILRGPKAELPPAASKVD